MNISDQIDTSIWKFEESYSNNDDFLSVKVYSHIKNCNNNGDKYLVIICAEGQELMGLFNNNSININDINDEDYDLKNLKSSSEIAFIIVGGIELGCFLSKIGKEDI